VSSGWFSRRAGRRRAGLALDGHSRQLKRRDPLLQAWAFAATMAIVRMLIHSAVRLQSQIPAKRGDVRRHAGPRWVCRYWDPLALGPGDRANDGIAGLIQIACLRSTPQDRGKNRLGDLAEGKQARAPGVQRKRGPCFVHRVTVHFLSLPPRASLSGRD